MNRHGEDIFRHAGFFILALNSYPDPYIHRSACAVALTGLSNDVNQCNFHVRSGLLCCNRQCQAQCTTLFLPN